MKKNSSVDGGEIRFDVFSSSKFASAGKVLSEDREGFRKFAPKTSSKAFEV